MGVFRKGETPHNAAKTVPYNHLRAITGSAQRVSLGNKDETDALKKRRGSDAWQTDAWEYFDAIGEIKYAANLIGSIMSRVRIFPAVIVNPDEPPAHVTDVDEMDPKLKVAAERALRRLDTANGGHAGILSRGAVNIWVAGECYLVQIPEKSGTGTPENWDIRSVDELVVGNGGKVALKKTRSASNSNEDLPDKAFVGRIWRSHPRYSDEADSSLRAIRDACDELLLYSRLSRTIGRSRMNAGALLLPDGLSLAENADQDAEALDEDGVTIQTDTQTDEFEDELMQAMTSPILDEDSAAAVVPMLIRGPIELLAGVKHLGFERSLDPQLVARADRALERVLQGLDMPKDVVTGLANVKYSNAVQIDESLYKAHIEPLILLFVDALTAVYFRPALESYGFTPEQARSCVVWYDPSEILTRPDRAQSANDGFDRKAISDDAWRRAHGFNESDAPTPRELLTRMVIDRAQVTEPLAEAVLKALDPDLMDAIRDSVVENNPAGPISDRARQILEGGEPEAPPPAAPGDVPEPPPSPASAPPAVSSTQPSSEVIPPVPTPTPTGA